MKKHLMLVIVLVLFLASCDQTHIQQAQTTKKDAESELDKEIRQVMEKGINLEVRKRQATAISEVFSRYTDPKRGRWLAALCYTKTLGTTFMPIDLAEIALAETGAYKLSATKVSESGALGVWQLMPRRAKSHGYSPEDMENDEKCAEAAVRELMNKMTIADGNLDKAKKYYCGIGPQANAYEVKRREFRREILEGLEKQRQNVAAEPKSTLTAS
jgi:hypothetical protein